MKERSSEEESDEEDVESEDDGAGTDWASELADVDLYVERACPERWKASSARRWPGFPSLGNALGTWSVWLPTLEFGVERIVAGSADLGGIGEEAGSVFEGFLTLRWSEGSDEDPEDMVLGVELGVPNPHSSRFAQAVMLARAERTAIQGATRDVSSPTAPSVTVDEAIAAFANEPTIGQVQGWAEQYARTNPGDIERLLVQSRRFAMLPELELQFRVRDGWDLGWGYQATDGMVDTPNESLYHVLEDAGADGYAYYAIKASWDLGDLILSNERIRLLNEVEDIAKLRDEVLTKVTKTYFERRRLQVEERMKPAKTPEAEAEARIKLLELTAELDAMTGGRFSEQLQK